MSTGRDTAKAIIGTAVDVGGTAAKLTGYGTVFKVLQGAVALGGMAAEQLPLLLGDGLVRVLKVLGPVGGVTVTNTDTFLSAVHYLRTYQRMVTLPGLDAAFGLVNRLANPVILSQDQRVVESQSPDRSSLTNGEVYVPSDRPIVAYLRWRQSLIRASEHAA